MAEPSIGESPAHGVIEHLEFNHFALAKDRISHLKQLNDTAGSSELGGPELKKIASLLFQLYARYTDKISIKAILRCLTSFLSNDDNGIFLGAILKSLLRDCSRPQPAPILSVMQLEFAAIISTTLATSPTLWKLHESSFVEIEISALNSCLSSTARPRLKSRAVRLVRQTFRTLLLSDSFTEEHCVFLLQYLTKKTSTAAIKATPVLCVFLDTLSISRWKSILDTNREDVLTFFCREIAGSKVPLPRYVTSTLRPLFTNLSLPEIETKVVPSLEKGLLRSPEVILDGILVSFTSSLNPAYDISAVVHTRLLKPLISATKSSNARTREGAVEGLVSLLRHCRDNSILSKIVNEIVTPMKESKVSSVEQRVAYSNVVTGVAPSLEISSSLCSTMGTIAARETNELALKSALDGLSCHATGVLSAGYDLPTECVTAFTKGCKDKKPALSKLWAFAAGKIFFSLTPDQVQSSGSRQFVRCFLEALLPAWKDIMSNPVVAAQSGSLPLSFVPTAVLLSPLFSNQEPESEKLASSFGISDQFALSNPMDCFLFNARVLTKLTGTEEIAWHIKALAASSSLLFTRPKLLTWRRAWCQSVFFHISSKSSSFHTRKEAFQMLRNCYQELPEEVGTAVIDCCWTWLGHLDSQEKDSLAMLSQSGKEHLSSIISVIFPAQGSAGVLSEQLIQTVVLCRAPLLEGCSWIQLCLKVGIDPNELVTANKDRMMDAILESEDLYPSINHQDLRHAISSAAADLTFVAPEAVFPRWIDQVLSDLSTDGLPDIGVTEMGIYNAPEGEPFVNVLEDGKVSDIPGKKTNKDYDTLKWEQEVRAQLASKRGDNRKLTAEERAKIAAQVQFESDLRRRIQRVAKKLLRGVCFIESALQSPLVAFERWILSVLNPLLNVIKYDKHNLLGHAATIAFLNCSSCVTDRLETTRRNIGVAILRLNDTSLPSDLVQEPLNELVTRVLYRIRISSDQYPLDLISISYLLPLILIVLQQGGVSSERAEEKEEQIVLALESLSLHIQQASDIRLPRSDVLKTLLSSLSRFLTQAKLIKECLFSYVRSIAGDITKEECDILLEYSICSDSSVRAVALQAIDADLDLGDVIYREHIWLACHDETVENSTIANDIRQENKFEIPWSAADGLVKRLGSSDAQLRGAAARALGSTAALHKDQFESLLSTLKSEYLRCVTVSSQPAPSARGLSRRAAELVDQWETRSGVALAFKELAPVFNPSELPNFFKFLIENSAFQDSNLTVREQLIAAGTAIIVQQGASQIDSLFSIFESGLEGESKSESQDLLREAIVILYGTLATLLPAEDERIPGVTNRLLETLKTPSETVQQAISDCLPSLVRGQPSAVPGYIERLEEDLLKSSKYGAQRGAAYGLAGLIRGCGIAAVRQYQLLEVLNSAVANRKEPRERQGAFLAFELLPTVLGRTFEPYVLEIVPQLLAGFGDTSPDVRAACLDASKAAFSILSSYGVKTILPTLLGGLDDTQWRSKKGACELLGAMAFLDPRQLAERLPEIIPPLTNVLADSHKEVRAAANRSLARFGDVLRNPEIHAVVDDLLAALSNPARYTEKALDKLIRVSFVHYLDAPSLAVVVRVLERGLSDRSSTKQKSAQIIASLAHLADKGDLLGHLPVLVAGLRTSAVDPVPATRATASKALGTLVEKLGEDVLPDLIPSLMETLRSDVSAGDRLGSAQALSEVLAGLGTSRLEETLPTILQGVRSNNPAVREGFMSLFVFLPACFGGSFAAYLGRLIPSILSGLADDVDSIRETALKAARLLVKNFAARAVDLFLPELERGLGDDSHRIRLSSTELIGDLLFNLTGLSKSEQLDGSDEDPDQEDEHLASLSTDAGNTLLSVLGPDRRNRIFAALYVCRSDTSSLVRQKAIDIWKALVASPRMLRELVPSVSRLVVRRLSSSSSEQQTIAAAALGDLVRKAGDGVLATLLPTFEAGLNSADPDSRRGICLGLRELLGAVTAEDVTPFDETIFAIIQAGLVDMDGDVRTCAAEAFDALQELVGRRAVERILPNLLSRLYSDDGPNALRGVLTLLTDSDRAAAIVPNVLPALLSPPMTTFNAKALAAFSSAAPSVLVRRLQSIVHAMVGAIVNETTDSSLQEEIRSSLDEVLVAMADSESLDSTLNILLQLVKHEDPLKRAEAARRLATFFSHVQSDYSRYDADLLHALIGRLDDANGEVVLSASTALNAFTGALSKVRMEALVAPARDSLLLVGSPGTVLPGFALPRGAGVLIPIFVHGLTTGSAENRTTAALALSDLISRADADALKPFVIQLTGALIRVVSDRSPDVRAAVLLTLLNLLQTAPALLKSFLPQLQRAFAKSLTDPASDLIRSRAADALAALIVLTPRLDPLVVELVSACKSATEASVKAVLFKSLYDVVKTAGQHISSSSCSLILGLISADPSADSPSLPLPLVVRQAALVAVLVRVLPEDSTARLLRLHIFEAPSPFVAMLTINSVLVESPETISSGSVGEQVRDLVLAGINTPTNEGLCVHSLIAAGKMLLSDSIAHDDELVKPLIEALGSSISTQNVAPIRRMSLVILRALGVSNNALVAPHIPFLVPLVYDAVRDRNMQVKLTAETAFISILDVVESESAKFDEYISAHGDSLGATVKRSMTEYFRRVGTRLAAQEREKKEAEGGQGALGLSTEKDDLAEIWQPFVAGLTASV